MILICDRRNISYEDAFCGRETGVRLNRRAEYVVTAADNRTSFTLKSLTFEFEGASRVTVDFMRATGQTIRYQVRFCSPINRAVHSQHKLKTADITLQWHKTSRESTGKHKSGELDFLPEDIISLQVDLCARLSYFIAARLKYVEQSTTSLC